MSLIQFGKAVKEYLQDGRRNTTKEEYGRRLEVCDGCTFRRNWMCSECNCFIKLKAKMKSQDCPKGFWPRD